MEINNAGNKIVPGIAYFVLALPESVEGSLAAGSSVIPDSVGSVESTLGSGMLVVIVGSVVGMVVGPVVGLVVGAVMGTVVGGAVGTVSSTRIPQAHKEMARINARTIAKSCFMF